MRKRCIVTTIGRKSRGLSRRPKDDAVLGCTRGDVTLDVALRKTGPAAWNSPCDSTGRARVPTRVRVARQLFFSKSTTRVYAPAGL